jgi:hypothetical protein
VAYKSVALFGMLEFDMILVATIDLGLGLGFYFVDLLFAT